MCLNNLQQKNPVCKALQTHSLLIYYYSRKILDNNFKTRCICVQVKNASIDWIQNIINFLFYQEINQHHTYASLVNSKLIIGNPQINFLFRATGGQPHQDSGYILANFLCCFFHLRWLTFFVSQASPGRFPVHSSHSNTGRVPRS
jgi:hypothetical protein